MQNVQAYELAYPSFKPPFSRTWVTSFFRAGLEDGQLIEHHPALGPQQKGFREDAEMPRLL